MGMWIVIVVFALIFLGILLYLTKIIKQTGVQLIKQLQLKIVELIDLKHYRKDLEEELIEYRKKQDIDILAAELKDYREKLLNDLTEYRSKLKSDIEAVTADLKEYHAVAKDLKDYREKSK